MRDDEKMFQIGVWTFGIILLVSVVLQVSFRTQHRQINRVHRDIVQTQQKIAVAQASFASYVRPESLRSIVSTIAPKSEVVSFKKSVDVESIPLQKDL
jgi:hypothetical protein